MSGSDRSSEDQITDRNGDSKDGAHEASEVNKDSIGNWTRGHSCYILAQNLSTFCSCPKTLSEAEFKSNGLINLVEEISREYSIQTMAWLLLMAFSQVYSENWEQKAEWKYLKKHAV
jgi:hypothetical protein